MSTATSSFSYFPNLPPELRHQIWTEALPHHIEPAAFPFKDGCWFTIPRSREEQVSYFHLENLDRVPLDIPLFSVSHEARAVVLAWVRKQKDVRLERNIDKFVIDFEPSRDVLYISNTDFEDFCWYAWESQTWYNPPGELPINAVKRIAVPARSLADPDNALNLGMVLNEEFTAVEDILVIVDP